MGNSYITLKMIADELGLSVSTISRALNDSYEIRDEIKQRVIKKAKELGYVPNIAARNLRRNSSNIIGVIVPNLVTHFYSSAISGIEQVASKNGYYVIIGSSNESLEGESTAIKEMMDLRVSGLLISLSEETNDVSHLSKLNVPSVFFDRVPMSNDTYSVISDDNRATYNVTKQLIEKGKKRIAFIIGPRYLNITFERMDGYIKALKECGIELDENLIIEESLKTTDGEHTLDMLLSIGEMPDAVICMNDILFYELLKSLRRRRESLKNIPELVGYIDEYHANIFANTHLAIAHQSQMMGKIAAEKLFDLMNHIPTRHLDICPSRIIIP